MSHSDGAPVGADASTGGADEAHTPALRSAIVIVIDRLGAGFLGPYGNTWLETPALNHLASDSVLVETALADASDLSRIYRSFWSGSHALSTIPVPATQGLARLVEQAGIQAALLTDDPSLLRHPLAEGFGQQVSLALPAPRSPASSVSDTQVAQVCFAAIEWLASATEPSLLWLHAQGMNGAWDAPRDLAEQFRDEDDPAAYAETTPPCYRLAEDYDPDEVLSIMHAYAAQVAVVDACLGMLLTALAEHPLAEETLVIFTSSRGYPLGEHGHIGPSDHELFGETLQVPWLMRHPQRQAAGMRLQTLVQPGDLFATLADWFHLPAGEGPLWGRSVLQLAADEQAWTREGAFAVGADERAVRTPAWFLHVADSSKSLSEKGSDPLEATEEGQTPFRTDSKLQLYAKPDDRWEVNEVANRCGEIPQELHDVLSSAVERLSAGIPVPGDPGDTSSKV